MLRWIDEMLDHFPYPASVWEFDAVEMVGSNAIGNMMAADMLPGHALGKDALQDIFTPYGLSVPDFKSRLSEHPGEALFIAEMGEEWGVVATKVPQRGLPRPDLLMFTGHVRCTPRRAIQVHRSLTTLFDMNETVRAARESIEQTIEVMVHQSVNLECMLKSVNERFGQIRVDEQNTSY